MPLSMKQPNSRKEFTRTKKDKRDPKLHPYFRRSLPKKRCSKSLLWEVLLKIKELLKKEILK